MAARADTSTVRPDWMRGKVTSWLTTVDHKRVGALYVGTSLVFLLLGGLLALFLRAQLTTPDESFLSTKSYGQVLTLHATMMIYLFAMPIFTGLGSHLVPLLIGARSVAFPRLNALSYWLFLLGGVTLLSSFLAKGGPASGGWTGSVPLAENAAWPGNGVNLLILSLLILSLSSLLAAINLVVTIKHLRTKGMTWMRTPLFVWSMLVYSGLLLLIVPALAAALTMLLLDREAGTHFFVASQGGSTALFRHAFWFLGRPEVYILILPPIGIVSEVLPVFSRRPIFNYAWMVYSTVALGCLFLLVWIHRTFVVGAASYVHVVVIVTTVTIAAAVGLMFFDWLATLWQAEENRLESPLLFAMGFLFLLAVGGLSRLGAAVFSVHGSAEVVARLHYALYGSTLLAILAGLHYWWPKLYGRLLDESLARLSFWLLFAGFNLAFFFEYLLGRLGMGSAIRTYSQGGRWEAYNVVSTVGSGVMAIGIIVLLNNVFRARNGRRAGNDPWRGDTLEWYTTSPPPERNFDTVPPVASARPLHDLRYHRRESGAA